MPDAKRVFDVVCCLVTAPIFAVPAAAAAVAVRLSSPGPVIYRGRRLGRDGREFDVLKFRTMATTPAGGRVTSSADVRVTRAGKWLRLTKLDEVPQWVNVLRGDMSWVGPRPEDPALAAAFPDDYARVLTVRPGVTGPAAVQFRYEEELLHRSGAADLEEFYLREILPAKLALDLAYVEKHDLRTDLTILRRTFAAVWRRPEPGPPAGARRVAGS
jgi:lipopolysaccharide/colanic/teichoic acid biosynthesis glycosyltransferase